MTRATVRPIGSELSGLSHAAPGRNAPFLIDGERSRVVGIETRPHFTAEIDGLAVASVEAPGLGSAANILLFPGLLRRDFVGAAGITVETLLAAPTLPLVVAQWSSAGGIGPITLRVPAVRGQQPVIDQANQRLSLRYGAYTIGISVSPAPAYFTHAVEVDGDIRVDFATDDAEHSSLVVSAGSPAEVDAAIVAAAHAPAHALRAASGPTEGLLLRTGVAEIDEGYRWLRSRLAGQISRMIEAPSDRGLLSLGLAAIGTADRTSAEALLSSLAAPAGLGVSTEAEIVYGLLAARHASTFGDRSFARRAARAWANRVPHAHELTSLAGTMLADALHHDAPPDRIAMLRASSSEGDGDSRPAVGGERRLPMAGAGRHRSGRADWVAGLLRGEPVIPRLARSSVDEAHIASAALRSDPDSGWATWRRLLAGRNADAAAMTWDPVGADGSRTAELLLAVCCGLLGLEPDAASGRLRIAPRLPRHLESFGAEGLPIGAGSVSIDYRLDRQVRRFTLTPDAGAIPPLVIFEPSVPGSVSSVRIDGESADLELRRLGAWTVVPVQLPVDATRIIEVES
ncbi:MAG: hypothetical protein OEN56_00090 [Gemmatimonadota bacterium]|nr:hypothetical protein [Gemmatimonadota bacterium]